MTPLSRPPHQTLARPPRSQAGASIPVTLDATGTHITAPQGTPPLGSVHGEPMTRTALIPLDATGAHITAPQGTPQPCAAHAQPVTRAALAPPPTRARHSHGSPTAPADPHSPGPRSPGARRLAAARARTARPSIQPRHGAPKANPRGRL